MAIASYVLTVAEGKRLIAKAVARMPCVQRAMEKGLVAVCKGTTNAYVLEELLGEPIEKTGYVLGATIPAKGAARAELLPASIPEVIFRDGRVATELTSVQAAFEEMGPGDVIIKGANALDYAKRQAGVLIGHPEGGTVGAFIGRAHGRKINVVIPVGLEKQVVSDLRVAEVEILSSAPEHVSGPSLWVIHGQIVTELEAVEALAGVNAMQIGAGGIGGAEGAVWLAVKGDPEQVAAAAELIGGIQGEAPFASRGG